LKLLVAAHDAGGAELLSAWLRREEHDASLLLEGPARAIFAGTALSALPPLAGFDLVLCGSSEYAPLERHVVRAARAAGVRCAVWLDHWVNYPQRFVLDGTTVLPDELWVCDEHAARLARETVPGPTVRLMGNPYLEDAVTEIAALTEPHAGEHVLYVTEGGEQDIVRRYLEQLPASTAVRLRPHPAEPPGKYVALVRELAIAESRGTSLVEDCAWADTVAGGDTMALVVALKAGRRAVSVLPRGSLPFSEIERWHDPRDE
jgi:hypothetical protein